MEFVKVERPAGSRTTPSGRTAAPSEFQPGVDSLTVGTMDTLAAFVPLEGESTIEQLKARITRSLVKAGKNHPKGPCTVRRVFDSSESGTTVTFWLIPLIKREKSAEV